MDRPRGHYRSERALWTALIVLFTVLVIGIFAHRFTMRTLLREANYEEGLASRELALGVKQLIDLRIRSLQILTQIRSDIFQKDSKGFDDVMGTIWRVQTGYYALNWIDADGVIRNVYPKAQNRQAIGRKVTEHPEVREYLVESRDQNAPRVSHLLKTYQTVEAFTIYIPVRAPSGRFNGWLNAVIDHRPWLDEFLDSRGYHDLYLRVCWERVKDNCYSYGVRPQQWKDPYSYRITVANQSLEVESYIHRSLRKSRIEWIDWIFFLVLIFMSVGFAWVAYSALRLHEQWMAGERLLKLRNACIRTMISESKPDFPLWEEWIRRNGTDENLGSKSMLGRRRALYESVERLQNLTESPPLAPLSLTEVPLGELLAKSMERLRSDGESRNVKIEIAGDFSKLPLAVGDSESILDGVFTPLLQNAAAFTAAGSVLSWAARTTPEEVWLELQVPGHWSDLDEVDAAWEPEPSAAEVWTAERLGLFQIPILMNLNRGDFTWSFAKGQTRIELVFQRSRNPS